MPSSFSEKLFSRGVTSTSLTAPHQPNPAPTPEPNLSGLVEGQLNVLHTWNPSCCLYPRNKSLLILIHFWQASLKKRSFLKASLLRGQLIADWMFLFLQASSINQNTLAQSNPARVTGDEF